MLACEHLIERLLQSFAALGFRPKSLVIVDNAVGISACLARVANNLACNFPVRVNPHIDRPHHHAGRQRVFDVFVFLLTKILCDLERHDSPVAVMTKNRLIGNPESASNYFPCRVYLFPCVAERLGIQKIQRRWKIDDQVVTKPVLRQWRSITVCDLPAWSWHIENISAREFLRLESRDDGLFFRRRTWTHCRDGRQRLRLRRWQRKDRQSDAQIGQSSPD